MNRSYWLVFKYVDGKKNYVSNESFEVDHTTYTTDINKAYKFYIFEMAACYLPHHAVKKCYS